MSDPPDPDDDLDEESPLSEDDGRFGDVLRALAAPGAGPPAALDLLGQSVGGKYKLLRLLGRGGMGDVYEATDPSGELVAVKLMSPALDMSAEGKLRFRRELRAAMTIESPHVVRVLDADSDPAQGPPFLVMERLRGGDLRASLKLRGLLSPQVACKLFFQACAGLAAAHALGIVHRDIKPDNLFLHEPPGGDVTLKICDFGIAKRLVPLSSGTGPTTLTQGGDVLGTLVYMSPEQLKSARSVDHRSDLWSLCASLYEALSGKKPWGDASSLGEIILAVATWRLPPLRTHAPWVPADLAQVVDRGLQRDLAGRWKSAVDLAAALQLCGRLATPGGTRARPARATP